jgi:type I restriction enzyme, S subunit
MKHLLKHFTRLSLHPKNAKELKGLILQLAVQGKLTDKWREENKGLGLDLDDLQKTLKVEAEFLKEEEKMIDNIEVPTSWLKLKFKTILDMKGGSQPPKSTFITEAQEGYVQLYQIRDFGKRPQPVYVPVDRVSKFCTSNDVMIGRYGASIGKVFYGKDGAYNVALVKLIWDRSLLLQDFVYHMFCSRYIQEFFQNCTRSAQAGFNKTDMGELSIPLPPIEEQKAIVEVVNQLFAEVEQLETLTKDRIQLKEDFVTSALQQLSTGDTATEWAFLQEHFGTFFTEESNIKKLRESILQLAVQGKLTHHWRTENPDVEDASFLLERIKEEKAQLIKAKKIKKEKPLPKITEEEIPYELPEGWVWCRLGDIIKEKPRNGFSPRGVDFITETKSLKLGATTKGFFDPTQVKYLEVEIPKESHLWLQNDDILIQRSNSLDYVGVSAIYDGEDFDFVYPDLMMKIQTCSTVNTNYLHVVLSCQLTRDYFRENASGTSGNMPKINQGIVLNTLIPMISEIEQKAIVEKVNALMGLCDQLEQAIQTSKATQEDWMKSSLREVFETKPETISM